MRGEGAQWTLSEDRKSVAVEGTPVLILGTYDFKHPAPWLTLAWWTKPIELPADPITGSGRRSQ